MPKHNHFRLQPKAEEDLENIYEYSYQKFGSVKAIQYIKDLNIAFHKLGDDPNLGRKYEHVRSNLMAYRVVSHVVFFKPSAWGITVIRVLHKSMDYERHL